MANLDGSRSHGGKHDVLAGAILRDEPAYFTHVYRTLLSAARAEGIGEDRFSDFLGLEHGGEFVLLGQDELGPSALEVAFKDQIAKATAEGTWTEQQIERILLAAARVGQHLFAQNVLSNCGQRCVFCGPIPALFGARRMLVAGHTKPWKDSTPSERLDPRNGLAACRSHDVAFDTGLLTVDEGLQIHLSGTFANAVRGDPIARQYYGSSPLLDALLLPDDAQLPALKYLDWHRTNVFVA
jgi:putative restriction endonuclease